MSYYDYTNTTGFALDEEIITSLELSTPAADLLSQYTRDDFLIPDPAMRVPFFAETRNYGGARERDNPDAKWIIRKVDGEAQRSTEMAMICFFIDHMVKSISAPAVLTRINAEYYKATKIVPRSEQLSGANYTEVVELREQLMLDLVNRWIYCDEDRNPNNYLIRYNSRNNQILIAIDFLNVDLVTEGVKISGTPGQFGWSRSEKTRYLTPLKAENFLLYDMSFFNMRLEQFSKLDLTTIHTLADGILRFSPDRAMLAGLIAENLHRRIAYVASYFAEVFPSVRTDEDAAKYSDMGKSFTSI